MEISNFTSSRLPTGSLVAKRKKTELAEQAVEKRCHVLLRDNIIRHFLYQHIRRLGTYAPVWQMSQTFVKEWGMHVERRLRMSFLIYWSQVLLPALSNRPSSLVSNGLTLIKNFFLNDQPDAPVIQIYSVIKLYVFRASSLPIIRSFLLYIQFNMIHPVVLYQYIIIKVRQ